MEELLHKIQRLNVLLSVKQFSLWCLLLWTLQFLCTVKRKRTRFYTSLHLALDIYFEWLAVNPFHSVLRSRIVHACYNCVVCVGYDNDVEIYGVSRRRQQDTSAFVFCRGIVFLVLPQCSQAQTFKGVPVFYKFLCVKPLLCFTILIENEILSLYDHFDWQVLSATYFISCIYWYWYL